MIGSTPTTNNGVLIDLIESLEILNGLRIDIEHASDREIGEGNTSFVSDLIGSSEAPTPKFVLDPIRTLNLPKSL